MRWERPGQVNTVPQFLGFFSPHIGCCPGGAAPPLVGDSGGADFEFEVKSYSIISDIAYIALTAGRQLPSHSERPETPFL